MVYSKLLARDASVSLVHLLRAHAIPQIRKDTVWLHSMPQSQLACLSCRSLCQCEFHWAPEFCYSSHFTFCRDKMLTVNTSPKRASLLKPNDI